MFELWGKQKIKSVDIPIVKQRIFYQLRHKTISHLNTSSKCPISSILMKLIIHDYFNLQKPIQTKINY